MNVNNIQEEQKLNEEKQNEQDLNQELQPTTTQNQQQEEEQEKQEKQNLNEENEKQNQQDLTSTSIVNNNNQQHVINANPPVSIATTAIELSSDSSYSTYVPQQIGSFLSTVRSYYPSESLIPSSISYFWTSGRGTTTSLPITDDNDDCLQEYLEQCLTQEAQVIRDNIMNFIDTYDGTKELNKQSEIVRTFIDDMVRKLKETEQWKLHSSGALVEALELRIMSQLYTKIFLSTEAAIIEDLVLHERIHSLRFLTSDHLGIPPHYADIINIESPQEELSNMNLLSTPKQKLDCMLRCCKAIIG